MKTVRDFARFHTEDRKISMVTCYDAWSARILAGTEIDCILVGDSAAMVAHGHDSTLPATVDMLEVHVAAVRRGAPETFLVGDFPFLEHRQGVAHAVATAGRLMRAGAQAVKIEGVRGHDDVIHALVEAGVPVMGHLGLTPQSIHQLGGFTVQAKGAHAAKALLDDARTLEQLGCFALVLECVPSQVAADVTAALSMPTIGIGAGPDTSGQVLVLQDLLGMDPSFQPRFVRRYLDGHALIRDAVNRYARDVRTTTFPNEEEAYHDENRALDRHLAAAAG